MARQDPPRSQIVFATLRDQIRSGAYPVGSRLPTERELTERFHASRVVVREALAALQSVGMAAARRGSGTYVTSLKAAGDGMVLDPETHAEIVECLELRLAIEVEAAGLAAQRRSDAQLEVVAETLAAMKSRIEAGLASGAADWEFHLAVARATNNGYFQRFMQALGPKAIPRAKIETAAPGEAARVAFEAQLLSEHMAVHRAIVAQDHAAAREAMRRHLRNALDRYRHLRADAADDAARPTP